MSHFFFALYSLMNKKKPLAIVLMALLFVWFGYYASQLKFNEDITRLIPSNDKTNITSKVINQLNFADKITLIIANKNQASPDELTDCANELVTRLQTNCNQYIGKIQGKIDETNLQETFDFVYQNAPLFLDQKDYAFLKSKIQKDSIANIIAADYKSLLSPSGMITKDFILKDPLGITFLGLKKLQQLSVGTDFELHNGFLISKDHKRVLLFLTPKLAANETDKNSIFISKLYQIQSSINAKYKAKIHLSFFGATPVAVANATQIKADVQTTSIFASISLIFILLFFYRNIATPLLIFVPSLLGATFSLAILFYVKGSVSAISLGISSILLGETTDYSIYVLTHLRNNKNVKLAYKDLTKPLLMCGVTTAITFLCLYFVKSEALKDLGLFAALSVTSTSVFSLLIIPFLYQTERQLKPSKNNFLDRIATYEYHKNKVLVVLVLLLLITCFFTYSKVGFNNDLAALNFVPSDIKQAEKDLEHTTNGDLKTLILATYGTNYEKVIAQNNCLFETLKNDEVHQRITAFSSIGGIVLDQKSQLKKINDWNNFWNSKQKATLENYLQSAGKKYGFKETAFDPFYTTLDAKFKLVSQSDYAKVKALFLEEFCAQKNGFYTISTLVKVTENKRNAFVKQIIKTPNVVIVDRKQTNETFLGGLKASFETLVSYSFIAISLILLLAFRRIELVIVSSIPIGVSWILTTGIMGIFGIQFNIINIIVCTLIFGIGVDYSIFMTTALQKEFTYGKKELPTYRTSILLSVATTLLGIGVLVFAKHPALYSISIIAIIGIFSTLVITFVFQPLVFNFIITNRTQKGKAPFRWRSFLHGILSFCYYGFGGFLMSVFSVTLLKILPLTTKIKMQGFRYVISKFMKSVLYTNGFVTKTILNPNKEQFHKPAVIIANHTSFLDILAVGMLNPKIIFLVSDWVYNSPVFGGAVKAAGFYPISAGLEGGLEHLRPKIATGFSIIIFPEGTRSKNNQMNRFHKGAFYLAEHFNLDILPVLVHGNSEVLPKGDFIIYDGSITVKILDRITPDDKSFGVDYTERTKKISAFFKAAFNSLRKEIEIETYFKKMILNSYFYMELKVFNAVKKDVQANLSKYDSLNVLFSQNASILHIGNDFGQLNILLYLQEPKRKISGFYQDEVKFTVAKGNYLSKKGALQSYSTLDKVLTWKGDFLLVTNKSVDMQKLSPFLKTSTAQIITTKEVYQELFYNDFTYESGNQNWLILKNRTT